MSLERRIGRLEAEAAAVIDAQIYAYAVACARVHAALTPAEWFAARVLYGRDAATPAEVALVEHVEALEAQYGVNALGDALEQHMSRGELVARRDAVISAVSRRAGAGVYLSADDRIILAAGAPFDALCRRLTDEELQAFSNTADEQCEVVLLDLARKYGFLPEETI
jgi:hypothetical protein